MPSWNNFSRVKLWSCYLCLKPSLGTHTTLVWSKTSEPSYTGNHESLHLTVLWWLTDLLHLNGLSDELLVTSPVHHYISCSSSSSFLWNAVPGSSSSLDPSAIPIGAYPPHLVLMFIYWFFFPIRRHHLCLCSFRAQYNICQKQALSKHVFEWIDLVFLAFGRIAIAVLFYTTST